MKTQRTALHSARLLLMVLLSLVMACGQRIGVPKTVQPTTQSSADNTYDPSTELILTVVEEQPSFPGGQSRYLQYLVKNLRYPEAARKQGVTGRVFVSFVVTKEGRLREVGILKGLGFGMDEEVLRLVEAMPKWNPGKQSGRPVHVRYTLAIRFEFENNTH